MKVLDLEHLEAQFGLVIRDKENHDNYALIRFEDPGQSHRVLQFLQKGIQTKLKD